jgi:membrane protein DedA with SNARE-associated domain
MNLLRFVGYSILGSSIWNGILIGAGWFLGANWGSVEHYVKYFQYVVIVVVGVAGLWFIWKRWSGRNSAQAPTTTTASRGGARRDAGL